MYSVRPVDGSNDLFWLLTAYHSRGQIFENTSNLFIGVTRSEIKCTVLEVMRDKLYAKRKKLNTVTTYCQIT